MLRRLVEAQNDKCSKEGGERTHLCKVFGVHLIDCGSYSHEYKSGVAEIDNLVICIAAVAKE